jgi:hypothetical protein
MIWKGKHRDRIKLGQRSGERYPNIPVALKVSKNTVASTILKWIKFGTTKTLPRADILAKLRNQWEKGLGQGGDQEPDGHSNRELEFLCGDGRTFQKDNHLCSTPSIRPLRYSGQMDIKPVLSKSRIKARLEFAKGT